MYGNVVADQFQSTGDYPFGAALAVSLMVVLTIVVLVVRRASAAAGGDRVSRRLTAPAGWR